MTKLEELAAQTTGRSFIMPDHLIIILGSLALFAGLYLMFVLACAM